MFLLELQMQVQILKIKCVFVFHNIQILLHGASGTNNTVFNLNGTEYSNGNSLWRISAYNYYYSTFTYVYANNNLNIQPGEYGATYITVPPITFEFQPEGQQVDYQNYTDKPWAVQNSYSNSSWAIGEFIDYAEYLYIDNYLFDSEGNTIANYRYYVGATNSQNSNLFINTDELYIKSRLLNYGQIYSLALYCYDSDENMDSYTYNYIFLPLNASITAGVITDFGSGDYTIQNSTNDIIDNQVSGNQEIINNLNNASEVDNILNENLDVSGDIEDIASDLGFTAFDNPFTSFLFFVIDGAYDVMTEREDIDLTTNYKSLEFDLASTDFITPESELKTFIRNMLICVYIYGNYKYFHYMITLLETARINKFMAEIGTDEFYDTDIM